MDVLQSIRPMVGMNGWDYCVYWKLGDDQRCLEWTGCCCCGVEIVESGEEQIFGVSPFSNSINNGSSIPSCRDVLFPHPRTKTCDILTQLPISIQLDSGIHAQAFLTNQPRWINFSDSTTEESFQTRVLIPSMCGGGLLELFISKHVSEDPQLMQFISSQPPLLLVQNHTLQNSFQPWVSETDHSPSSPFIPKNNNLNLFQPWPSETDNSPWDMGSEQIRHSNSPLIFLGQQFPPPNKHDIFLEGSNESVISDKPSLNTIEHDFQEVVALQKSAHGGLNLSKELTDDKDLIKQEMGRAESVSDCSDQMEDDDDQKVVGKSGKKHQSKNLVAERKRRKKLNERLYALRALVPKITKMDRASILGDAIEYVKELQKQVKQLQDELEENPEEGDNEGTPIIKQNGTCQQNNNTNNNNDNEESRDGLRIAIDQGTRCSSSTKTTDLLKQNNQTITIDDKAQQMEVQVEVNQGEGNEFNLKIFCEKKAGGFVRLMQAMDVLGLEVVHVNITTFRGLVLNVFKAEMRDNEIIQPEQVRDSLLELTRNPNGWSEAIGAGESGSIDHHQNNHHHLHFLNHQH